MPDDPTEMVDPEDSVPVATGRTPTPTAKTYAIPKSEVLEFGLADPDVVIGYLEKIIHQLRLQKARDEPVRIRVAFTID